MTIEYNLMIGNLLNGMNLSGQHRSENVIYQSAGFIRHSCGQCDMW